MSRPSISKYLEFLLLLAFLLPPVVQSLPQLMGSFDGTIQGENHKEILEKAVNPSLLPIMIQGFFAIAMMFRSTALDLLSGKTIKEREKKASSFIRLFIFYWILPFLLVLGVLLGNSLLWNIFAQMQGRSPVFMPTIQLHSLPLMICATSIAAFYEEILYRWYSPKLVSYVFFPREKQQVTNSAYCWWLFIEALFITIFALSHGYGGVFAVTNAFVAGIILRLCVYYTKSPWVGFFSHLAYNLIQFTILLTN